MASNGDRAFDPSSYPNLSSIASAHLSAIVDSSDDAIISKNLDGIIQSWNRSAERMFGYTAAEAIGKPITILLPEDRKDEEETILAKIRRGERIAHYESIRVAKDGHTVHVSITISPIRDANNTIIGASKVVRSIDERLAAETTRARLAAIIESSDDAILSKDLNGVIQSWNRGAERLFGYMSEEMVGRPINILLPPDRQDEERRILERLRRGERIDHFETIRMRKDGRLVEVSVTISPIRDAYGKVIGASKVARDITDRKVFEATMARVNEELETRVRERTNALEAAHQEMEAFTHSIAHDLRGALRGMVSTSALVMEDYGHLLPAEGIQHLTRQVASAKRLNQLVSDLLSYSKLGQSAPNPVVIDMTQLAHEVAEDVLHSRPGCVIHVQDGLSAHGDRVLIRILLQNLIDNACKFSPDGGEITVGREGGVFFVRDQGMGFNMAFAEKIFMPFERLVRNDVIAGTGIGLASVKRIIEKHGGTIWTQSVQGQGTTFYFTLPTIPHLNA